MHQYLYEHTFLLHNLGEESPLLCDDVVSMSATMHVWSCPRIPRWTLSNAGPIEDLYAPHGDDCITEVLKLTYYHNSQQRKDPIR